MADIHAIVQKMIDAGESEENIASVIRSQTPFDVNKQNATMRENIAKQAGAGQPQGLLADYATSGPMGDVLEGLNKGHEGNYVGAIHGVTKGVGQVLAPAALPAIAAAPVVALGGMAAGAVGDVAGRTGASLLTDNPDYQDIAGDVGGIVGGIGGSAGGLRLGRAGLGSALETIGTAVKNNPNPFNAPLKLMGKGTEMLGKAITPNPITRAAQLTPNIGGAPTVTPGATRVRVPYTAPTEAAPVTREAQLGGMELPATIQDAILNQQATARDTASRATLAGHPGAYGEGGIMPNGITPTELRRPMPMSEAQMAPANAAAVSETAAGPKAFIGTTPAKSAAQATADVANRRNLTGVSPTGIERRAPIQLDPASVAAVGGPPPTPIEETLITKSIPQDVRNSADWMPMKDFPASKSKRSPKSLLNPKLTLEEEKIAFGDQTPQRISQFDKAKAAAILENRASRHGIHHATAQMDAYNKSQGIDPMTEAILDRTP